jgi:hypothetical protein
MDANSDIHVPFAQLPITDRFLYFLGGYVAILLLHPWSSTEEEVGKELIRLWDDQKYTPADIVDFNRMAPRLEPLLAEYAAEKWQAGTPQMPPPRRRRHQN